ncbi:MAG TPA: ATP-binding protein [Candidatus Dormibacteraeota bacterium]|nr:ATP-binding protein [Candidatus Dormibacteraeota bacterium]
MTPVRTRLTGRLGLRARMTASYVVVTFVAVLVVEGLGALTVIPNVNEEANVTARVVNTANWYAKVYGATLNQLVVAKTALAAAGAPPTGKQPVAAPSADPAGLVLPALTQLGTPGTALGPGKEQDSGDGVLIPLVTQLLPDRGPMSLAVILDTSGRVYASSYPARYPVGSAADQWLPAGWDRELATISKTARGGAIAWATAGIPVDERLTQTPAASPDRSSTGVVTAKGAGKDARGAVDSPALLGYAYVQVPVPAGAPSWSALQPLLQAGLVLIGVTVPMGVVFGMLTTTGLVRRLRRLAAGTVGFASGDFTSRVPESGADELGQLESHFNRMAERLQASIAEQRALAERNARLAERSRISRELHDSISQDLFSMGALVGGLRRALPPDVAVRPQLETLSTTVASAIREMRALLLELRPTALEEKGLMPALAELCEAYEVRVGVRVRRELEPVPLDAAVEQAVFRIAQEGLSNAVRHSEADEVVIGLRRHGGSAELTVSDNGRGFDVKATTGHGLGLRLMAERIRELGGTLEIDSAPGRGTRLRVLLPALEPR